jgi:hypothetical protein
VRQPWVSLGLEQKRWVLRVDLYDDDIPLEETRHLRVIASAEEIEEYRGDRFEPLVLRAYRYGNEFGDLARAFVRELRR